MKQDFICLPRKETKRTKRSLIFGRGENDAHYQVKYQTMSGEIKRCPRYGLWNSLITRAYSSRYEDRIDDIKVSEEWWSFTRFLHWYDKQKDIEGKLISHRGLMPGNLVYGPDTTCFLKPSVHNLLDMSTYNREGGLRGTQIVRGGRYKGVLFFEGKAKALGHHVEEKQAHKAFLIAKRREILFQSAKENNLEISSGLILYAQEIGESLNSTR